MDTRTGKLWSESELREAIREQTISPDVVMQYFRPANATPEQAKRGKVGRNDRCPCGSDKKFKKCCLVGKGVRR